MPPGPGEFPQLPMKPSPVVDVSVATFQSEVVERSRQVPVLLDFWAAWCGPCKTLGPLLEKLAVEHAGRFVLAKIDVDRNPELAEVFRIQSIPSVILVKDGRPVDGFLGALPEAQLRAFLEPHLAHATRSPREAALELEGQGRIEEAITLLREHLRGGGEDAAARVTLARLLVGAGRTDEASKVFARLAEAERQGDEAQGVAAALALAASAGDLGELEAAVAAAPQDPGARIALGKALLAARRHAEGLDQLLHAAMLDVDFDGGAPRKALQEAFQALGPTHRLTLEYQQQLSVLLCS